MAGRVSTLRYRSRSLARGSLGVVAIAVFLMASGALRGDTVLLVVGLLLGVVAGYAAVRSHRMRLTVADGDLRLHGMWRTRRVPIAEVRSVSMRAAGTVVIGWHALELLLVDGSRLRCFGITAPATRPERLVPALDWIDQRLPQNRG